MKLLAFDTSTERMAVAVLAPAGRFTTLQPGGAAASTGLLPAIHALVAEAGLALRDLDAIAFGHGPGAFTGLRTSCAVAQGLGFGLDRPLLALDSLLVVAEDARRQADDGDGDGPFEIAVAMDARIDEIYGGIYRHSPTGWETLVAPGLYALPDWLATGADSGARCVAGSAIDAFGARLALPAKMRRVPAERNRAEALLTLAEAGLRAGQGVVAADALPLYLRDKVALTTIEREQRAAAG
jgi:tRNA threonylcarbamoyladenosine biosynthesis protein TsaB